MARNKAMKIEILVGVPNFIKKFNFKAIMELQPYNVVRFDGGVVRAMDYQAGDRGSMPGGEKLLNQWPIKLELEVRCPVVPNKTITCLLCNKCNQMSSNVV